MPHHRWPTPTPPPRSPLAATSYSFGWFGRAFLACRPCAGRLLSFWNWDSQMVTRIRGTSGGTTSRSCPPRPRALVPPCPRGQHPQAQTRQRPRKAYRGSALNLARGESNPANQTERRAVRIQTELKESQDLKEARTKVWHETIYLARIFCANCSKYCDLNSRLTSNSFEAINGILSVGGRQVASSH